MATRFLLIRHAAADLGNPPRLCGTYDVSLSNAGREQLRALESAGSVSRRADALYVSPLLRARLTAEAFGRLWDLHPITELALEEIHCGQLEGLPIERIQREHPLLWQRNLAQDDDRFRWPGGESYAEFRGRVLGALTRLAWAHGNQTVAIVTHAGVIAQVVGTVKGRRPAAWERGRPDPLSVTDVLWDGVNPLEILAFNHREVAAPTMRRG